MGLAGAWLCLALAACGTGATGATPTATTAGTVGTGTTPQPTQPGSASTPFGSGTPSGVLGTEDVCTVTGGASASLPSTLPLYPGAQLRIASTNGSNGVFGLCIADTAQNVNAFYAAQLPKHGWQKVTDEALDTSYQLTASQGSTNLVITISPDAAIPANCQAILISSGS